MKIPYDILGVDTDASDDEIKQAYLQQVKSYPPDRNPNKFQAIKQAYEAIKDRKNRLNYALFTLPSTDLKPLLDEALKTPGNIHPSPTQLAELLDASLDEEQLLDVISAHH